MNFFDHKDLGNHLLQLCPKVVKHPVYCFYSLNVCKRMYGMFSLHFHLLFAISWYYYAIQWVTMSETPIYKAALLEVRVQLEQLTL